MHAVHVSHSGGDSHRDVVRFWSVQEWLPQGEGHCEFL
jgi:hypothetical protein